MAADVFTNVLKAFTARLGVLESRAASVLYGRVETVNPLSVRQSDGSLLLDVETLEPDLDVGDPVRMLAHNGFRVGSRVVVVGRVGVPVLGRRIPAAANLNTYTVPGQYFNPLNVEVAGFTNGPPSGQAGALVVLESAGVIQYWHEYGINTSDGNTWRRRFYSGAWSAWVPVYGPIMAEKLYINGVGYDTSGYWGQETLSSPNYTTGATYAWTLTKTFPALPSGDWSYKVHVLFSNGYTTAEAGNIAQGQIRVTNVGSSSPTVRLGWQLVRGVT